MAKLRQGYCNEAKELGVKPKGAKPWTEELMFKAMAFFEEQLLLTTGMKHLLLLRDALIMALLWQ